ncbi:MAG: amylo-alpha-1,6-glucosidase, partial [Alphaproteobacteria bacterium]
MNETGATDGAVAQRVANQAVQFYIPATTSLLERRPRTLKHGNTFAVLDHYGDIIAGEGSPEGLFHDDTRHLSRLELRINDRRPLLLSSTIQDNNVVLTVDLTNPDFFVDGHLRLERDTLHIVRSKFLWQGACYERLAVHNFDTRGHRLRLGLIFAADFADLFEVRGHTRPRRGRHWIEVQSPDTVVLHYQGLDRIERRTTLRFAPDPVALDEEAAAFELDLKPGQRSAVFVTINCTRRQVLPPRKTFFVSLKEARRALRAATSGAASVETSNQIFNEILCRAMADLYMLIAETPQGPYPYAGIPWFSTAFGRDGIIAAIEMLWIDPGIAKGVLRFLATHQARTENPASDAEPGKILHEMRRGEMARLGEVPFAQYYGAVDSTPLFVLLAGLYYERTGDLETIRALWPHIEAALAWIDTCGDLDGDGFVEYRRKSDLGLINQGWKDSHDSVFHADGRLAEGPIALCEVQGYVYAAKRHAARLARVLGLPASATTLEQQAASLKERFEAAFWCEDIGTYALALDGAK